MRQVTQLLPAATEVASNPAIQIIAGGAIAVIAGAVGAVSSLLTEDRRQRASAKLAHRERLRDACGDFSATLTRIRHLAWRLREAHPDPALLDRITAMHEEARTGYERVRLLSESLPVQEEGRLALRHSFALWQVAQGKEDQRGGEFVAPPRERFEAELTRFYIEVRRELGLARPEEVMVEPSS